MAYLKDLVYPCANPYCSKRAVVAVYTWRNEHYADYCRRHGDQEVNRLKTVEVKADA